MEGERLLRKKVKSGRCLKNDAAVEPGFSPAGAAPKDGVALPAPTAGTPHQNTGRPEEIYGDSEARIPDWQGCGG